LPKVQLSDETPETINFNLLSLPSTGDSFYLAPSAIGFTFTFNAEVLRNLPTHVGIVWTDGVNGVGVTFEAFDAAGNLLGTIGPSDIADGSFSGTTTEDHFFGAIHPGGISKIKISDNSSEFSAIEIDHLQYGFRPASASGIRS
jgi:hypothetical protein